MMNNIASERASLEEQRDLFRRSQLTPPFVSCFLKPPWQFFYRWKACIDRSVRLAEEAKFVHQRESLMADMKAMYDLMLQVRALD
jgi:hypothetical protein